MIEAMLKRVGLDLVVAMVKAIINYCIVRAHVVRYRDISQALSTGLLPKAGLLAQALEAITEYDHAHGLPLSAAVVVSSRTGLPGKGFFKQCRRLGYEIPETVAGEEAFQLEQLKKLGRSGVQASSLVGVAFEAMEAEEDVLAKLGTPGEPPVGTQGDQETDD